MSCGNDWNPPNTDEATRSHVRNSRYDQHRHGNQVESFQRLGTSGFSETVGWPDTPAMLMLMSRRNGQWPPPTSSRHG